MAKFGFNLQSKVEEVFLELTLRKRLTLIYHSPERADAPQLSAQSERYVRIVNVSFDPKRRVTTFTLEANENALSGTNYIYDKSGHQDAMLRVVVGTVKNHDGFPVDLLAEVLGRSQDPKQWMTYQAILNGKNNDVDHGGMELNVPANEQWDVTLKDQPLLQITARAKEKQWNCGAALEDFGTKKFTPQHYANTGKTRYYKPFKPKFGKQNRVDDIVFDKDALQRGVNRIRTLLNQQKTVTIFAAHDNGFDVEAGVIKQRNTTHFLTIFGVNSLGDTFLVADPWPRGSRMWYRSGVFGDVDSGFLGLLKYFPKSNVLQTPEPRRGSQVYTVLEGP